MRLDDSDMKYLVQFTEHLIFKHGPSDFTKQEFNWLNVLRFKGKK